VEADSLGGRGKKREEEEESEEGVKMCPESSRASKGQEE